MHIYRVIDEIITQDDIVGKIERLLIKKYISKEMSNSFTNLSDRERLVLVCVQDKF